MTSDAGEVTRGRIDEVLAARRDYDHLLATLRAGGHVAPDQIVDTIRLARVDPADFIHDYFAHRPDQLRPGDRCPRCGADGAVRVRTSKRRPDGRHVRYLQCGKCGKSVGKQTVATSRVRKRRGL